MDQERQGYGIITVGIGVPLYLAVGEPFHHRLTFASSQPARMFLIPLRDHLNQV
jgi:hypothetical protein